MYLDSRPIYSGIQCKRTAYKIVKHSKFIQGFRFEILDFCTLISRRHVHSIMWSLMFQVQRSKHGRTKGNHRVSIQTGILQIVSFANTSIYVFKNMWMLRILEINFHRAFKASFMQYLSHRIRKPTFCICEQKIVLRYTDNTDPLILLKIPYKFQAFSYLSFLFEQPVFCWIWSETMFVFSRGSPLDVKTEF